LCRSEAILLVAPVDGLGTGVNSTQDQSKNLTSSQSTLHRLGACGVASHTQSSMSSEDSSSIFADASASPSVHLPSKTSLASDAFSRASKLSLGSYIALVAVSYLISVFVELFPWWEDQEYRSIVSRYTVSIVSPTMEAIHWSNLGALLNQLR
jgi:hypothetical protein